MNTNTIRRDLLYALAIGLFLHSVASSTPISLPTNLSGAGANWAGVGSTNFGVGTGVNDGNIGGQFDAFDSALTLSINGNDVVFPTSADLSGSTVTTNAASNGVFSTIGQYFASQTHPVLRALFSITNTGTTSASANVSLQTNSGADNLMSVINTSSSDTIYSIVDRWVITDEAVDDKISNDPASTHVLWGVGALETLTVASTSVFPAFGTEGIRGDFSLDIGPGETQNLMFFLRIDTDVNDANAFTNTWQDLSTLDAAGLLVGLSQNEQNKIVNWASVPEPGTWLLALCAVSLCTVNIRYKS